MGWIADLLKEIPSAARYKAELEQLVDEHSQLKEENANLRQKLEEAESTIAQLQGGGSEELGPEKEKILQFLAANDRQSPESIAHACEMGVQTTTLHLDELFETDHITNTLVMNEGAYYHLDQQGRKYLAGKGLLD